MEVSPPARGDGGVVTFEGVVRDNARGKRIRYLVYDAYQEMAEQQMASIVAEVQSRWETELSPSFIVSGAWRSASAAWSSSWHAHIAARPSRPAAMPSIR